MKMILARIFLIMFAGGVFPALSLSAESGWNEAGVRAGYQVSSKFRYFRQYEAFAVYGLPWEWRAASGWGVTTNANIAAGILNADEKTEFISSVGTALIIGKQQPGLAADLGINMNLLNRRHFAGQDFGSLLQFGAYLGVNYRLASGLKLGYRLQHISNGHVFYPRDTPNPGLDLHLIGVSYVF